MRKNLLVVDDELPVREVVAMYFKKEGFQVSKAASGQEGMGLIRERSFDVVILDMALGDVNGLDLLLDIKKLQPNARVIIYTGQETNDAMVEKARNNGADGFLTKDQKLAQMRDVVACLIGE